MRTGLVLITFTALVTLPIAASAAVMCPDRTPAAVTKVAAGATKCQEAIAKAGAKFLKSKVKVLAKCKVKQPAGSCPLAADTLKIQTTAAKSAATIANACGDDAVQGGLTSSYAGGTDDGVISSCTLSQLNVAAELVSAETHGATTEPWPSTGSERANCVKTISKAGALFLDKAHKNATKCLGAQMKAGTAGNLTPICVGSFAGGSFVPPTDIKAAEGQAKLVTKVEGLIASKCGAAEGLGHIVTMFACPGAATVADLQMCVECGGWTAVFDSLEAEYSETGEFVANGPGALQAAINAASPGDKLLLGSGTYAEEASITASDLSIVGCGGATNDRPKLVPPGTQVFGRGIRGFDVNDLAFQSLDVGPYQNDGIFISDGNNLVFRDIVSDAQQISRYAVFPVRSNNVLIELCVVRNVADAGIYIGQSSTVVARYNDVRGSVAGTEFENCGNGQGYGNYATGNTGGMLVFLDGSLPIQVSDCHQIHHNLFENNNGTNYGTGTVSGVPEGTGLLVISNDSTPYSYNILRGNNTFGMALVDETAAGFAHSAVDPTLDANSVFANWITNNGNDPDTARSGGAFGDLLAIELDTAGQFDTCISDNIVDSPSDITILMPFGDPVTLAGCASFNVTAACPAPPVTSSSSTTTTTSTTTTSTLSSPSGAFLD